MPLLEAVLGDLAAGRARGDAVDEAVRLAHLVTGRGACHHPDGTARLVLSTLAAFAEDVEAHLAGWCLVTGALPVPRAPVQGGAGRPAAETGAAGASGRHAARSRR